MRNNNKNKFAKMLSSKRFYESDAKKSENDGRNAFENDYTRIALSSYVRRLQDKAQVFPLEQNDFVRTRLTHSLEVSCFAKGLGLGVEKYLLENDLLDAGQKGAIPSILETAGLIHDIGNPPFGHFGEESIRQFFAHKMNSSVRHVFEQLTDQEKKDFLHFDGNVQGFRILKKLGLSKYDTSFNLTFALLSTIIKYPFSSLSTKKSRKIGYYESEEKDYKELCKELGLNEGQRHPLTYLLEAADDIAYSVCDIEDGCKLGIITENDINKAFCGQPEEELLEGIKKKQYLFENDKELFVQQLRIKIQTKMLNDVIECFNDNFINILNGDFLSELLSESKSSNLRKIFKDLGSLNFSHKSVLKRELLGDKVITYLLDIFTDAVFNYSPKENKASKNNKVISLLCSRKKDEEILKSENTPKNNYNKFQKIVDYISGTTDTFALHLYQEFNGITNIV